MDALRYAALAAAVVTGIVLLLRPTAGLVGLALLLPLLTRFIPRAQHGLNAETPLFMLALLVILLRARPALPPWRVLAPFCAYYLCVFFGFAILAANYDADRLGIPLFAWAEAMKSDLWPTLLFFIAYALTPRSLDRRRVFGCMVVGLAVYSFSGLVDFFGSLRGFSSPTEVRAAGLLAANPNLLGGHLGAVSVIALIFAVRRTSRRWVRISCGAAYVLSVFVLALTQSRGSWLGFLAGHAVWLAYANRRLLVPVAAVFLLVAAMGYSLSLLPGVISKRIDETFAPGQKIYQGGALGRDVDSSVAIRLALYRMGGEMFLDSPIWGHGYGGFLFQSNKYGAKYGVWSVERVGFDSESLLLTVAVNNGLIGLTILAWLAWTLLRRAFILARLRTPEREVGVAFLSVCTAVGLESLTQNALNAHEIALPFWLTAGVTVRAFREHWIGAARPPASSREDLLRLGDEREPSA